MPLLQIKNFFIIINLIGPEVFKFGQSMSQENCSKCGILRINGKGCSYLILSLIIGKDSVRLGSMSK